MEVNYIFVTLLFIGGSHCANILVFGPVPAFSHYILTSTIAKELAFRGHNVTFVALYQQKKPISNLKEIVLTGLVEETEEMKKDAISRHNFGIGLILFFNDMLIEINKKVLSHENVQQLFKDDERYDLVILERFGEEPYQGFAHRFKVPYILLSTIGASLLTTNSGFSANPSYVPAILAGSNSFMTFWQRVKNTLQAGLFKALTEFYRIPKQEKLLHEYFPDAPSQKDLDQNVSLYLMNSHPSIGQSYPYVQNMIDIGGFHIQQPKPLPKDIKSILDNATEGAIYFSMGSNVPSSLFTTENRRIILNSFLKLKLKVLWKFDGELPFQPDNVHLGKWFPQNDILAHPNVKLFITHGGLLSTTEAIYHGVPLLGIPVIGDQKQNVIQAESNGFALHMPLEELTEETFTSRIQEILSKDKYYQNVKERSRLFHDRPMKPLDTAMYWIEYVIRHRGAPHLKSITTRLEWYQLALLDVTAFLLLVAIVTGKLIHLSCKKVILVVSKQKTKTKSD